MAKAKKTKRTFPMQVESALDGLRLERQQTGPDGLPATLPRPKHKPTPEDIAVVEKLIRAIESI